MINPEERVYLTWYSFLKPLFSFKDMFAICASIFLTGMFLLVGGPRFVFSGKAYVVSPMSFGRKVCVLKPVMNTYGLFFIWHNSLDKEIKHNKLNFQINKYAINFAYLVS